jgi:hypothetical protein
LRQAVQKGYNDAAHMKKDPDLDPLRSHPEFQKLLQELEAKPKMEKNEPKRARRQSYPRIYLNSRIRVPSFLTLTNHSAVAISKHSCPTPRHSRCGPSPSL